jgi:UDP-N-acetyl-D-mannosaminouronate:lipid I N-acetyl-D-mannosaminouronosyltransferase
MNYTDIGGLKVFSFASRSELIEYVDKEKKSLIAVNAEKILHADEQTKELINNNIGYPDGAGAVMALKRKGFKSSIKIPGCELWLDIVSHFNKSKTFYLVGAKQEVIDATVTKLQTEFPGIKIVGYRNGFISSEAEKSALIEDICKYQPQIVFIAMGSPKQELLMQELQVLNPAIYQGLGGSFDVYVGRVNRAPTWWVRRNLEWAYRLYKQPWRIKRQIHLVRFFFDVIFNRI